MIAPKKSSTSLNELLEKARAIAAKARGLQQRTEQERRVPNEVITELLQAGLMRARQPKQWGGLGLSAAEHYQLVEAVSRGCGSTGWVYCVLSGHADDVAAQFSIEAQEEVWGIDRDALASSSFFPNGWAEPEKEGYVLSGEFRFSSGCDHAKWAIVGSIAADLEGGPGPKLFLVPMGQFSIKDNWFTHGLGGTGSKTLMAQDVYVPRYRTAPFPLIIGSTAPFSLSSVMVGAARGMLELYVENLQKKPLKASTEVVGSEHLQMLVGEAWAEIDTAWTLIQSDVRDTERHQAEGGVLPRDVIIRNRAHNTLTTKLLLSAIEKVHSASGSSIIFENSPMSRLYQAARAGLQHASINQFSGYRDAGFMILNPDRQWTYPPLS